MLEKNDPSIKLFGKMIQLGSNSHEDFVTASVIEPSAVVSAASADFVFDSESSSSALNNLLCSKQDDHEKDATETGESRQEEEPSSNSVFEEAKTPTSPSTSTENSETLTKHKTSSSQDLPKKDQDQDQSDQSSSNSDSPDQTTLKKPDKIIPCPRCTSMDTKFCYFNNYNVNQPRHFCKSCQRYWTAGGSMRSVPVGAGRRKSKNCSASQPRHLVTPEASDGLVHHVMRPDGSVCAFGLDPSHPNQSEASMLKIGRQVSNGFFVSENNKTSNCSSVSVEQGANSNGGMKIFHTIPCYPYSWTPITWQPGFSMPFYSAYNLQWVPNSTMNSDQSSTSSCSPNSTSLGKHSREGTMLTTSKPEKKNCSKPKTLRFVDPSEAAKSSICTTLGIKKRNKTSTASARVALFGELQQAKSSVNYERTSNIISGVEASSMVLQANPAAFSSSLAFHEIAQ